MEPNMEVKEDTQHGRYLTFVIGKETYGLEISQVIEIVGIQPITRLPEAPEHVRGVINLRGRIIPVMDVRLRFGLEPRAYDDKTCIIIAGIRGTSVGLIVDIISEVLSIEDDSIAPPPAGILGIRNKYIAGIGLVNGNTTLLLDCDRLLSEDGLQDLINYQERAR